MGIQMNTATVAADEVLEVITGKSRERDDDQKALDNVVSGLRDQWHAKAKTDKVKHDLVPVIGRPKAAIEVAKTDVSELKRMLRRAATLHKVEIILFKDKTHENGLVRVMFTIGTPAPKVTAATPPASTTA